MGMSKDINNLIKEFKQFLNVLQNANSKYRLNHKVSRSKEGLSNFNMKVNTKFNNLWCKTSNWIRTEIKK
jgi:hypothetical protein